MSILYSLLSHQTVGIVCICCLSLCLISSLRIIIIIIIINIVRVVKSRRMRWAGHVARMGEVRVVHRVLVGKPEGKSSLGRPRLDGRVI